MFAFLERVSLDMCDASGQICSFSHSQYEEEHTFCLRNVCNPCENNQFSRREYDKWPPLRVKIAFTIFHRKRIPNKSHPLPRIFFSLFNNYVCVLFFFSFSVDRAPSEDRLLRDGHRFPGSLSTDGEGKFHVLRGPDKNLPFEWIMRRAISNLHATGKIACIYAYRSYIRFLLTYGRYSVSGTVWNRESCQLKLCSYRIRKSNWIVNETLKQAKLASYRATMLNPRPTQF